MANELTTVRETLKRNRHQLLKRSNVVATGVGYKITAGQKTSNLSIVCSVTHKVAESQLTSQDMVPKTLEGAYRCRTNRHYSRLAVAHR